jgi:hypothetical protein
MPLGLANRGLGVLQLLRDPEDPRPGRVKGIAQVSFNLSVVASCVGRNKNQPQFNSLLS